MNSLLKQHVSRKNSLEAIFHACTQKLAITLKTKTRFNSTSNTKSTLLKTEQLCLNSSFDSLFLIQAIKKNLVNLVDNRAQQFLSVILQRKCNKNFILIVVIMW